MERPWAEYVARGAVHRKRGEPAREGFTKFVTWWAGLDGRSELPGVDLGPAKRRQIHSLELIQLTETLDALRHRRQGLSCEPPQFSAWIGLLTFRSGALGTN